MNNITSIVDDPRYSEAFCPPGVDYKLFPLNWKRHQVMINLIWSFIPENQEVHVLEVGAYLGQSALTWNRAIAGNIPKGGSILCVDPWQPFLHEEDVAQGTLYKQTQNSLKEGAFEQFQKNIALGDAKAPIRFFRGTLASLLAERPFLPPFDLVYIDGSHYYEDVKEDLRLARTLVAEEGFLCGDDLECQFNAVDQEECINNGHRDFINGYHPGVTRAVWEFFGGEVWCSQGIWVMRREGAKFVVPF